jgi:GNAT superfamily N-acetyltransferase
MKRAAELCERCSVCRYWEQPGPTGMRCGEVADAAAAERWFATVNEEWGDPGRVAFQDRVALGMIKYAPSRYFARARTLGPAAPSEDAVLIACIHIMPEARDIGLGTVLLQSALADLRSRGELIVEAYGSVEPASEDSPFITANFLLRHGFTVARPHPDLPLLRLELKALEAWTDSLESALEALQVRLTPQRAPGTYPRPSANAQLRKDPA